MCCKNDELLGDKNMTDNMVPAANQIFDVITQFGLFV